MRQNQLLRQLLLAQAMQAKAVLAWVRRMQARLDQCLSPISPENREHLVRLLGLEPEARGLSDAELRARMHEILSGNVEQSSAIPPPLSHDELRAKIAELLIRVQRGCSKIVPSAVN